MSAAIVRAQLLKTIHTRGATLLLIVLAAAAALATLSPALLVGQKDATRTTIEASITVGALIAYLLGVGISAGDRQHGMTRALQLIQPRRYAYLASCAVTTAIIGSVVGVVAAATAALTRPLAGTSPTLTNAALTVLGGAAAGAGYAVSGLAVGVLLPNQIGAASIGLLYTLVAEPLISQQSYGAYLKLPGGAREALVRHVGVTHHIPPQPIGLLTLTLWALTLATCAAVAYAKRDIT